MSIVEDLIANATADVDLLRLRDRQGDVFGTLRDVDFVFSSVTEKQAGVVASFLTEYQYVATASVQEVAGEFRVTATLNMPTEQNVLGCVSGFMQCIAALYSVTYDGWGANIEDTDHSSGKA
ncbi:ribonuclease E inhibitor RraB [Bacillus sp. NP157]|nr:ribonuclease E inhibitor RraB [Bacillus sp. NP157]